MTNNQHLKLLELRGIGSGKSTVSKYIEELGFPVYNSDYWAKELVNFDENLKSKIINLLGENSYDEKDTYNRTYVASIVFENENLLHELNKIIHPAVKEHFENWVKAQHSEFVFKETALLFELKLNEQCYQSILVTADDNIRIKRVMDRDKKRIEKLKPLCKNKCRKKIRLEKQILLLKIIRTLKL